MSNASTAAFKGIYLVVREVDAMSHYRLICQKLEGIIHLMLVHRDTSVNQVLSVYIYVPSDERGKEEMTTRKEFRGWPGINKDQTSVYEEVPGCNSCTQLHSALLSER